MLIPFSQPLDLANTLHSGQAFRWRRECASNPGAERWHVGVIFDNVVRMRQVAEGIEFSCGPADETAMEPIVRDYLRLQDDLETIYEAIDRDDRIGAAIARYRGMRILRQDPWECLISFICSANNNIRRISANVEDMANSFGRPVELGNHVRATFPMPEALAEAGEQQLRRLKLGFRAMYVASAARIIADRRIDLNALREASYEEALQALTALPGVGDKIANCVLLFSLDKLEAFPVDVWVHRALREWYLDGMNVNRRLPREAMRPWGQAHFGPFAGYANLYLFHGRRLEGRG